MPKPKSVLTRKQQMFFDAYLKDFDPRAAYLAAGYDPKYVNVEAYALLRHPQIASMLETYRKHQRDQFKDLHLDMVSRLIDIVQTDMNDLAEWDNKGPMLKPSSRIAQRNIRAISEISGNEKIGTRLKTIDKIKAMELLARITGIMKEDKDGNIGGATPTKNVVTFRCAATPEQIAAEYDVPSSSD